MNKIYRKSLLLFFTVAIVTLSGCKKDEKVPTSSIDFTAKATNLQTPVFFLVWVDLKANEYGITEWKP